MTLFLHIPTVAIKAKSHPFKSQKLYYVLRIAPNCDPVKIMASGIFIHGNRSNMILKIKMSKWEWAKKK